eukprot:Amastigsp_a510961_115.p5 type:complete len:173 gc:universal Amastigsp_a510961_115:357-875(+)
MRRCSSRSSSCRSVRTSRTASLRDTIRRCGPGRARRRSEQWRRRRCSRRRSTQECKCSFRTGRMRRGRIRRGRCSGWGCTRSSAAPIRSCTDRRHTRRCRSSRPSSRSRPHKGRWSTRTRAQSIRTSHQLRAGTRARLPQSSRAAAAARRWIPSRTCRSCRRRRRTFRGRSS